jgi:parallel beta-helix repeat protein
MEKTRTLGVGILAFFCIFSFFFSSGTCEEITKPTVYVGGSGPGNYTLIQAALDNVTAGGTVYVFPGTYHEHIVVTTPVHLVGDNKDSTIIDGDNEEYVVILDAGNSTLSGFMITHSGRTFPEAGVYVKSDKNIVSGNILTGNFYGMRLESTQRNTISGNEIIHNLRCGIYFSRASNNILTGNIVSNHSFNGFGLYEFSNNNTLLENILSQNNFSGINIRDSIGNRVVDNRILGDRIGLHIPPPEYNTVVHGNVFSENRIDLEEERDPLIMIGAGYGVFIIVVFLVLKKWKT